MALYLDYFGSDDVEATINQLTGGTKDKPTIGVILDIQVSEELYNLILEDPDFVRESIVREKRVAEINASLSDEEVKEYIRGIDDQTLDSRYWVEQQNKWETEEKERAEKRLGRQLESYEEQEIEAKAETRFLKFRERYEVTSHEREQLRRAMTREDVVSSILVDQDMNRIEREVDEGIRKETENNALAIAILVAVIVVVVVVAMFAM